MSKKQFRHQFLVPLMFRVGLTLVLMGGEASTRAQNPSGTTEGADRPVSIGDRSAIVDSVSALLNRMYVFPEKAKATGALLHRKLRAGAYDTLRMISQFTSQLTADMQQLTHDGHLFVDPADAPPVGSDSAETPEARREARFAFGRTVNFGFQRVEILQWNIGYLNLKNFFDADVAGPTAIAAMNLLANCQALIIDIRENGGGQPSMIQMLSSYFFDQPVHLNNFFDRRSGDTIQFWTQSQVVGPRLANVPLYILTSHNSFSAAEEFAYNLKVLKRARLIGETTGGGAHPNDFVYFPSLHITVSVAWGWAFNPVTGTNWEGTGVTPDIPATADNALAVARMMIIDSLRAIEPDSIERQLYSWTLITEIADTAKYQPDQKMFADVVGTYGPRKLSLRDGRLWYQRDNNPPAALIPLLPDLYQHSGDRYFRIQFVRDSAGLVSGLVGLRPDGTRSPNDRAR